MKGISTIIASIILVVITIGLISVAYLYMTGLLTGTTAKNIELMDAYCDLTSGSNYNITALIKNIGTTNITIINSFIDGKTAADTCSPTGFVPQETITCSFNKAGGVNIGSGMHQLRIISSTAVGGPVNC
jgi:hypothetical protein